MNNKIWNSLFESSSFFSLSKSEELSAFDQEIIKSLKIDEAVHSYHANRKEEFLRGRLCAYHAYKEQTGLELLRLPSQNDRSPLWPNGVVGSITHSTVLVGVAIAKSEKLKSVGIDFEEIGRTKLELASHLLTDKDISLYENKLNMLPQEVLTLIFSAKEALYKTLYPEVKKFFGFHDAAVTELQDGKFSIELLKDLNEVYGINGLKTFHGRYCIHAGHCLFVIELK
jgi:enterobactin synthetase component D